jgi:hypothetical protein
MIIKLKENWGLKTHGGHCPIGEWVGMYIMNELLYSLGCKASLNFKPRCEAFTQ